MKINYNSAKAIACILRIQQRKWTSKNKAGIDIDCETVKRNNISLLTQECK